MAVTRQAGCAEGAATPGPWHAANVRRQGFTLELETTYRAMQERRRAGLAPDHITATDHQCPRLTLLG